MFYIYILYSEHSDKYYVGHSDHPERRLMEHNASQHLTYTSKHRPWKLKCFFPVSENRGKAIQIEKYIKSQKSKAFIKKIIENKNDKIFFLSAG